MYQNEDWTIEDSMHAYQIGQWSEGYFSINKDGELCASPEKSNNQLVNISSVLQQMRKQGIQYPCVIRFQDILRSQVKRLNESFAEQIKEANFKGEYWGVFPIKVNQLREVVEEVVDAGSEYNYGLEAGSKAELLAVLAHNTNKNSLTILNGYKDQEYMELALLGTQLEHNIVIVIEKLSEIHSVMATVKKMGIKPQIGVRAKLNSRSGGKWAKSSGDKAKFGLTVSEILELVDILKENDLLDMLTLFHFHVGSQIPDIRSIKDCINEGARIFCELKKLGANLQYFDAGGGVGLNYDGSRSNCASSTNYTLEDYIADVVYILRDICNVTDTAHPHIVTETGRAVSAHHSCVVTNVFGEIKNTKLLQLDCQIQDEDHLIIKKMKSYHNDLNHSNYQDVYNDASIGKEEAIEAFKLGVLGLQERAFAEKIFWNICSKIINMTENEKYIPSEIKKLKFEHADTYLCNFSVFQSTPDSWAIDQILPIVPITRLNESPNNQVTIADITCDSDGSIYKFLSPDGHLPSLQIHQLKKDEEYPIGIFLTGAYQDIMGDMHNLFGRLNEVHVYSDEEDPSGFYIEEVIKGQSSADVLKIMQYSPENMCKVIKERLDKQIRSGKIKARTAVALTDFYEEVIHNYTYLSN